MPSADTIPAPAAAIEQPSPKLDQRQSLNPPPPHHPAVQIQSQEEGGVEGGEEAQTQTDQPQEQEPQQQQQPTPGPRASAFLNLYQKTLATTLRTVSYENFAACFPAIARNAPENLRGLHKAMLERLEGFAVKDFEALVRERAVVENLNALEELIQEAARRKARAVADEVPPTPPHLLPPSSILAAHLAPQLALTQSHLNAKAQTTQSQNALLWARIERQRAQIEGLVGGLEDCVADLEGAGKGLAAEVARGGVGGEGGTGVRDVVDGLEVEMGGVV